MFLRCKGSDFIWFVQMFFIFLSEIPDFLVWTMSEIPDFCVLQDICPVSDKELIARSVRGMRIVAIFFPIIGMQMVTGNFFQSIGMARQAIFLSLTRQLIFLLPCLIILPTFWGADGVWASLPTADLLSWIVSVSVLTHYLRKFKQGKIEYKL